LVVGGQQPIPVPCSSIFYDDSRLSGKAAMSIGTEIGAEHS
jgi:hypothetical protein